MTVGIVGDFFIDRYHIGTARGLSAEVAIPIIDIQETFDVAGGAANVRANLRSQDVEGLLLFPPTTKTNVPIKNRLIVDNHQLARWDENDFCTPYELVDLTAFPTLDALIVSDYGKGAIQPNLVNAILTNVAETGLKVFVDTKQNPSSWLDGGDNVWMFPNLREFKEFQNVYEWFPNVVLKQGALGISLLQYGQVVLSSPSVANQITSVNGAGDTVIATFAKEFCSGGNIKYCLDFANAAAAVVISKPFTSVATNAEIAEVWMANKL